ncbi:MAG: hypothetical protein ACFFEF_14455, partial [Candidatus Thorarchaeota archaeon]
KTPLLIKNELKMLYNQFIIAITTPSMLAFYIITFSGALFVSSITSTLFNLAPLFTPLGSLIESIIDRSAVFTALGLLTLTSIIGGYFGGGPAEVLESPDEYILMPSPVHPHQLFIGRYIRRIIRKFFYIVIGVVIVIPLISESGLVAGSILLVLGSIIVFLEINYFLGSISGILKKKLGYRYSGRFRHILLPVILAIIYIPSLPFSTWHPFVQLSMPGNLMSIVLMESTGIHNVGFSVLPVFGLLLLSYFIALLVLSNISDYDYYEMFSMNMSREEAEGRFSRSIRGQVDFSESRYNDPMIWIILKDFWSKMRTPLQFWKYLYVAFGTIFGLYLIIIQPSWLMPIPLPPQYMHSVTPAFLLIIILVTQMAALTSLLAFVDEKDNIYLLRASPFKSKDIVLAKYILSVLEVSLTALPIYLFILYFFRVPGSFYLASLAAPMIIVFSSTGIMAGAYVPVFTNDPKNPPVPLAFSFPSINLILGGIMIWMASVFGTDPFLIALLPAFTLVMVVLFLSLSNHALKSYR